MFNIHIARFFTPRKNDDASRKRPSWETLDTGESQSSCPPNSRDKPFHWGEPRIPSNPTGLICKSTALLQSTFVVSRGKLCHLSFQLALRLSGQTRCTAAVICIPTHPCSLGLTGPPDHILQVRIHEAGRLIGFQYTSTSVRCIAVT